MICLSHYDFQRNIWQHLQYPVKALLFTIDLVSCRDVFRVALADEISLNKEYTVLVDCAIVSSVEKEADKTDLRDSRFDKA